MHLNNQTPLPYARFMHCRFKITMAGIAASARVKMTPMLVVQEATTVLMHQHVLPEETILTLL